MSKVQSAAEKQFQNTVRENFKLIKSAKIKLLIVQYYNDLLVVGKEENPKLLKYKLQMLKNKYHHIQSLTAAEQSQLNSVTSFLDQVQSKNLFDIFVFVISQFIEYNKLDTQDNRYSQNQNSILGIQRKERSLSPYSMQKLQVKEVNSPQTQHISNKVHPQSKDSLQCNIIDKAEGQQQKLENSDNIEQIINENKPYQVLQTNQQNINVQQIAPQPKFQVLQKFKVQDVLFKPSPPKDLLISAELLNNYAEQPSQQSQQLSQPSIQQNIETSDQQYQQQSQFNMNMSQIQKIANYKFDIPENLQLILNTSKSSQMHKSQSKLSDPLQIYKIQNGKQDARINQLLKFEIKPKNEIINNYLFDNQRQFEQIHKTLIQ